MAEAIRETLFYVVPRISPDGAEEVLKRGRYVRSSPVNDRANKGHAYWESRRHRRRRHRRLHAPARTPTASWWSFATTTAQRLDPPVMVRAPARGPGPVLQALSRGAHRQLRRPDAFPAPYFLSDNLYDFNRNFPYAWAPEPQQVGAGHYPGSAPETRAILEFATSHPNIFAWLNLHTFGGVLIRPLGDKPDSKMDPVDLAIFEQVEAWMTEHTGYATVSGFHEFLYEPEKPLHGDLTDYAYHQRGALAYVVELWDLFKQLGIERKKPFVDHYVEARRARTFVALAKFDREQNRAACSGAGRR